MKTSNLLFTTISCVLVLISSFLLFQIQPLISKFILPWFGGSSNVWTIAMLFFQTALLLGYVYSHLLSTYARPKTQLIVHTCFVSAALVTLPALPAESWRPNGDENPVIHILLLLTWNIGVPYVAIASTGPLIQNWYAKTVSNNSPWYLFSLSNLGSLLGLLTFPFLVERLFNSSQQSKLWSIGFLGFAIGSVCLALLYYRNVLFAVYTKSIMTDHICTENRNKRLSSSQILLWLFYSSTASLMLYTLTQHMSRDIAAGPLLWITPLSIYLLSFILCFSHSGMYWRKFYAMLTIIAITLLSLSAIDTQVDQLIARILQTMQWFPTNILVAPEDIQLFASLSNNTFYQISLILVALLGVSTICHGELYRNRPTVSNLTKFYLLVATGGAAGGFFSGIVFPLIFDSFVELHFGLVTSLFLAIIVFTRTIVINQKLELRLTFWLIAISGASTLTVYSQLHSFSDSYKGGERNFYGVLAVTETGGEHRTLKLINGHIIHGSQLIAQPDEPTTYYGHNSGVGLVMHSHLQNKPRRIGVVGLGVGTLSTYGKSDDYFRFYEIDPNVVKIANEEFTFLENSLSEIELILGDARLSMEREPDNNFDILAIDAFSSDSIPTHLLTLEAIDVYLRHLNTDGIMAFHVSNRYLNLTPILAKLAAVKNLQLTVIYNEPAAETNYMSRSKWVLIARDKSDLTAYQRFSKNETFKLNKRAWTDQYSSLFNALK